jgi:hypothetical protein
MEYKDKKEMSKTTGRLLMALVILFGLMLLFLVNACTAPKVKNIVVEKYTIDSIWFKRPVSIHDDMNPTWMFRSSDGSIHSTIRKPKIGDTIIYKKVLYHK